MFVTVMGMIRLRGEWERSQQQPREKSHNERPQMCGYQEGCFHPALVSVNKTPAWSPSEDSEIKMH